MAISDVEDLMENKRLNQQSNDRPPEKPEHPAGVDGYEPVLQISIPGTARHIRGEFNPTYEFVPDGKPTYTIFGSHTNDYIDKGALENDHRLQKLLTTELGTAQKTIRFPSASALQTQFVNPDSTIAEDNRFVKESPVGYRLLRSVLWRYVLKYHEFGSSESANGHFMTLNHPEEAAYGYMLPFSEIPGVLKGNQLISRALPTMYHEFPAFLEERRVLEELRKTDSPFEKICSYVSVTRAEEEKLKETSQDVLDGTIRELLSQYISPDDYSSVNRNSLVLETVDWLEEQVGVETALDLLSVPREATMHPDKWVVHLLHDIASGLPVEDIRANGTYWQTRTGGGTYDQAKKLTKNQRARAVGGTWQRAFHTMHESVDLSEEHLVRTWYMYEPKGHISLEHIRYRLFLQELFTRSEVEHNGRTWGIDMLGKTEAPAQIYRRNNDESVEREPFHFARYHQINENPFERARKGQITASKIGSYFDYGTDKDLSWKAWSKSREDALRQMGFDAGDLEAALEWVRDDESSEFDWA